MRWEVNYNHNAAVVSHLHDVLSVERNIACLLESRGLSTFDEAKSFFRSNLEELHNPFLMKDMDLAVERIEKALGSGERILVYGDYDVDGTTAVSLVYTFLKNFTDNIAYYIPDRYKEGYGISIEGIDYASKTDCNLVIALDCGIRAVEQIDYANKLGIDFIICDHHLPGSSVPKALAILDPKQEDCNYPYKELSGCALGFKLAQAFVERNNEDKTKLFELLDLVAISTACDIVPITGENRILAYFGLEKLNRDKRPAIKHILDLIQFDRQLTISDLVFVIGPRINAAGRMYHGKMAVKMLIETSLNEAQEICNEINNHNLERRALDQTITEEALMLIESNEELKSSKSTVVYKEDWHKGVIGIVASRLIETHYRPTIVLAESEGMVTGSARSVKGYDVHEAISNCSHLLEKFGGHKYAAGLSMLPSNVEAFKKEFEKVVSSSITAEQLIPVLQIDLEISLIDITPKFYRLIKQFAPFGPGNMRPVFITKNVHDTGRSKRVGTDGIHLKLDIYQKGNTNVKMSGIAFNSGDFYDQISDGQPFDIVYTLDENEWNGIKTIQLKLKDIRMHELG